MVVHGAKEERSEKSREGERRRVGRVYVCVRVSDWAERKRNKFFLIGPWDIRKTK